METKEKIMVAGVIIAVVIVSVAATYYYLKLRGHGRIKTVNINAYEDEACTIEITEVDWGELSPSEVKGAYIYLKNTGNSPVNVTMHTENWSPVAGSQYMTLTWNMTQPEMQPNEVVYVELRLTVAADITGINEFWFDIVITAVG